MTELYAQGLDYVWRAPRPNDFFGHIGVLLISQAGYTNLCKAYVAALRLAVALVCVGVSLIIGGIWFGLIPNESVFAHQQRQQKCESIALISAALVRDQQWDDLDRVLQVMANQEGDLVAIEINTEQHSVFVSRRHVPTQESPNPESSPYDLPRTMELKLDGIVHGTAAFYYHRSVTSGWRTLASHPLVRLLAFFTVAGVGVYTVFVIRMMKGFEVTQVVPDRIRQALDTLSEGLLVMDERERIVLANRSFSRTVGLSQETLVGIQAGSLPWVCSESARADDYPWLRAIHEAQPQTEQLMRYQLSDGSYRFFSINASPIESSDSPLRGALATFRDVTEFEEHRAQLEHMLAMLRNSRDEISTKNRELEILATQDALTGCLNRRALFEVFETQWREVQRNGETMACLMIDNDHFKCVNDKYGHHVGDEVLRCVSEALCHSFPHPSIVCRYGGEEFCVLLPGKTLEQAADEAEAARAKIAGIQFDDPVDYGVTVSIGVSELRFGASEPQELINQADKCLYVAKNSGRNQVVAFSKPIADLSIAQTILTEHPETNAAEATGLPFQAVTALVSALAFRDSETAEHSRRVADLCVRLASGILDQRNTYILEIAALLHDIGKIGVPDNVLLKPGPLNDEEWKLMRRHDRIGVEIATSTFNCIELSEIIQTHRAFYRGPDRDLHLPTAKDIPVAARLLAIADSYDAMVSDRVYRMGRSHDEAVAELHRCAGTQFDPVLVEHFATTITDRHAMVHQSQEAIPKHTAMQFGLQIERLADALDSRDVDGLQTLASRLGAMARHHRIESIAVAAEKIEAGAAEENMQWINLLRDTQLLLNLCRATQNAFLANGADARKRL